jgi:hypothetical protein
MENNQIEKHFGLLRTSIISKPKRFSIWLFSIFLKENPNTLCTLHTICQRKEIFDLKISIFWEDRPNSLVDT